MVLLGLVLMLSSPKRGIGVGTGSEVNFYPKNVYQPCLGTVHQNFVRENKPQFLTKIQILLRKGSLLLKMVLLVLTMLGQLTLMLGLMVLLLELMLGLTGGSGRIVAPVVAEGGGGAADGGGRLIAGGGDVPVEVGEREATFTRNVLENAPNFVREKRHKFLPTVPILLRNGYLLQKVVLLVLGSCPQDVTLGLGLSLIHI